METILLNRQNVVYPTIIPCIETATPAVSRDLLFINRVCVQPKKQMPTELEKTKLNTNKHNTGPAQKNKTPQNLDAQPQNKNTKKPGGRMTETNNTQEKTTPGKNNKTEKAEYRKQKESSHLIKEDKRCIGAQQERKHSASPQSIHATSHEMEYSRT